MTNKKPSKRGQTRDVLGRFGSKPIIADNPPLERNEGGRYDLVCKVTYRRGTQTFESFHAVIQDSPYYDITTQNMLMRRVKEKYNGTGIEVTVAQTIDRFTRKRLEPYEVFR
jgi:hypothetical protein